MDSNERYKTSIGFIDLLFNIVLGFAFLFIIAFLLIKPEAKKEDFKRKAEFVIILEWDPEAYGDVDLYVQDPTGKQCSFRYSSVNYMHLDKDDLGSANDQVKQADGSISLVKINREVITIRGIMEGEYIINGHYYSERNYANPKKKRDPEVTVKVELHKVNPYSILWMGEKKFYKRGDEETFLRFRLDKLGNLILPFSYEKEKFITPLQAAEMRDMDASRAFIGSGYDTEAANANAEAAR